MAFERQTTPRDVPFNPTRPLSELDPAPSTVSYIRTEPIRHSTVIDDTSREVIVDIAWDPYLYVKNDLRTWPAASEAKIWTPGPNNITLTFVPSLGDRSKDPSEFIQSLPQYKKHGANPDSKRNILLSWVRKLLCCVSPRKVTTSPYISYGGSDSKSPLVLQTPFP